NPLTTRRAVARRADFAWKPALALAGVFAVVLGLVFLVSRRVPPTDSALLGQGNFRVDVPAAPPAKAEERIAPPGPRPGTTEKAVPPQVVAVPLAVPDVAPRPPEPPRRGDAVPPSPAPPEKQAPVSPAEPRIDVAKTPTAVAARVERVKGDVR